MNFHFNQIKILDIKIDLLSKQEVLDKIKNLLLSNEYGKQLVTSNPEFIMAAQKHEEFKDIINNSWLSVADGYGIRLAAKYLSLVCLPEVSPPRDRQVQNNLNAPNNCSFTAGEDTSGKQILNFLTGLKVAWWGITRNDSKLDIVREVITGTDLVSDTTGALEHWSTHPTRFASQSGRAGALFKIFLLGGYGDTPKLAAEKLKQRFNIIDYSTFEIDDPVARVNEFRPDILFVALNHPHAQKWINENLAKMPSIKLAIGVGGAFDYISGKIKRAPVGWRGGFEWIYRLIKQPKRLKRIWTASVKFPWEVFMNTCDIYGK